MGGAVPLSLPHLHGVPKFRCPSSVPTALCEGVGRGPREPRPPLWTLSAPCFPPQQPQAAWSSRGGRPSSNRACMFPARSPQTQQLLPRAGRRRASGRSHREDSSGPTVRGAPWSVPARKDTTDTPTKGPSQPPRGMPQPPVGPPSNWYGKARLTTACPGLAGQPQLLGTWWAVPASRGLPAASA